MKANPKRRASTTENYRDRFERPLSDWLGRSLDSITRSDVEDRFNCVTEKHGMGNRESVHVSAALGLSPALR